MFYRKNSFRAKTIAGRYITSSRGWAECRIFDDDDRDFLGVNLAAQDYRRKAPERLAILWNWDRTTQLWR